LMIVKYKSHNGETFVLNGDGSAFTDVTPLRSYDWSYNVTNRVNGMGGTASSFARRPVTRQLTVGIRAGDKKTFLDSANRFHEITESDVQANQAGRLYVGDQYVSCYITSSAVDGYARRGTFATKKVNVLIVEPYWCSESTTTFNIAETSTDTTGKRFDLKYPFRYGTGYSSGVIRNNHYAACPAVITIYGPAENPSVAIGSMTVNVDVTLTSTEHLVIDQTKRTIEKISADGTAVNAFNLRNKNYNVFEPIPAGDTQVTHGGTFLWTVTLIKQRSELEWT